MYILELAYMCHTVKDGLYSPLTGKVRQKSSKSFSVAFPN